jgi:signal transduction histidine kinase/ketosteroid isomerase-like protein
VGTDLETLAARYHRAFNDRDFELWRELFDEDVELVIDGMPFRGVDAAVGYGVGSVSQFPGLYIAAERIVAKSEDTIVTEIDLVTGDPASGHARQQGTNCEICRVRDGRIVSCRSYYMPEPADRADAVRVPARAEAGVVAEEQAALRRVATQVATGAPSEEVFAAVAAEVGQLLQVDYAVLVRYDPDDAVNVVGTWTITGDPAPSPVGSRFELGGRNVSTLVLRTGRPARLDAYTDVTGVIGNTGSEQWGFRSSVGAPITVEGRPWGLIIVAYTRSDPLPPDTEERLAGFTELVATAIADVQARVELRGFAEEQAALRRVATLVAGAPAPEEVFSAVCAEVGRLPGCDITFLNRYDADGAATAVGVWSSTGALPIPVGTRVDDGGRNIPTLVFETRRPARIDDYTHATGPVADVAGAWGIHSAVGVPISVEGRLWGVMSVVSTREASLPADTEVRLAGFTELVATAIANAQARQELRELADTQAALRRLATLVARGEPPEAVFAAATREALRYSGNGTARMIRFELDGTATLVANQGATQPGVRVGERWVDYPPNGLTAIVWRTGRAARVDDYGAVEGGEATLREGIPSAVAVPIHVDGRLWGMIAVGPGPLPSDLEQRMSDFTDLVATAVANAQNRAEIISSRARIVAASDEVRRRIERDLHDGAQQRLLALTLRLRSAAAPHENDEFGAEVKAVAADLVAVIDELRETSLGIHPAILSTGGLGRALRALARRSAIPVDLDVRISGRLPEPIEVGAYYVVSEMLTNAAKHAHASAVAVDAELSDGTVCVRVRDDGVGGADPRRGSGLVGLKDRIEALGGRFSIHSPAGGGTTVTCQLPVWAGNGQLEYPG